MKFVCFLVQILCLFEKIEHKKTHTWMNQKGYAASFRNILLFVKCCPSSVFSICILFMCIVYKIQIYYTHSNIAYRTYLEVEQTLTRQCCAVYPVWSTFASQPGDCKTDTVKRPITHTRLACTAQLMLVYKSTNTNACGRMAQQCPSIFACVWATLSVRESNTMLYTFETACVFFCD